jgi:hypothetical protein
MRREEMRLIASVAAAAILVILIPYGFRLHSTGSFLMGSDSFLHIRNAQDILSGEDEDSLSFGGRDRLFDGYEYLLAGFGLLVPVELGSFILHLLFGISSALLFSHILRKLGMPDRERMIGTFLFISSPIFVYLHTTSNHMALVTLLLLAGCAAHLRNRWLSIPIFASIALFGPLHASVAAAAAVLLGLRSRFRDIYPHLAAVALTALLNLIPGMRYSYLNPGGGFGEAFSLFGAQVGLSIFLIFLAIAGMVPTWRYRKYYIYSLLILAALYWLAGTDFLIYINLILCPLAAYGIITVFDRRWELSLVRDLTLFIIGLGLLFLTVSHMHDLISSQPDKDMAGALRWISHNTRSREIVLSSQDNGFMIEYLARRPVVWDNLEEGIGSFRAISEDLDQAFRGRNLEETASILRRYKVRYILIDPSMQGLLHNERQQQGLPFLMRNTDRFRLSKEFGGVQVWEFMG